MQQKTQRQIDNIKSFDTNAIIYEEKQSDTIIFDEVSRMSRNADEGYNLYMELMERDVTLVFLKERHIDTDEYKRRTQNHIARVSSSNEKMDNLINGIFHLVADFEKENLKDNIRLAFQQAEHERLFLIKRVTEGKSRSEKPQGRPEGSHNIKTDKASKDFDGKFSDAKIMREYLKGIARNTYYKYKKELVTELNM